MNSINDYKFLWVYLSMLLIGVLTTFDAVFFVSVILPMIYFWRHLSIKYTPLKESVLCMFKMMAVANVITIVLSMSCMMEYGLSWFELIAFVICSTILIFIVLFVKKHEFNNDKEVEDFLYG